MDDGVISQLVGIPLLGYFYLFQLYGSKLLNYLKLSLTLGFLPNFLPQFWPFFQQFLAAYLPKDAEYFRWILLLLCFLRSLGWE
jgi:hypothetical protein